MVQLKQHFRKLSTSKQIVIIVVGIFTLVLVLASIEKILVYDSIQASQTEIPQKFFEAYEGYSLKETSYLVKQLIFSTIDFRASFIASLVNSIRYSQKNPISITQHNMSKIFKNESLITNCILNQPNSTIFSCQWDMYTKFIMEDQWSFQIQTPTRRLSLIYQNSVNQSDVMIKTISSRLNLEQHTIKQISQKMKFNRDGIMMVSNFYVVPNGSNYQSLVSFQTKVTFPGYSVLILMETYGNQFTTPLSKILYPQQVNVAILAPKSGDSFDLIASASPLDQGVDFKCLLHEGFRQKKINANTTITSYTIPFSSQHRLGQLNYARQKLQNQNYVIVVYTFNINQQIKQKIFHGIINLRYALKQVSIIFLIIIIIAGLVTIGFSYIDMIKNFKVYTEMIKKYMKEPQKFSTYVNCKNQKIYPLLRSNSFLRMLNFVIKMIEWKKKEFRRKSNHHINDQFPLNIFDEDFQDSQKLKDFQRFQNCYRKLEMAQKSKSDKLIQQSQGKSKKN